MPLLAEQLFKFTHVANQDHSDDTKLLRLYRPESTEHSVRDHSRQLHVGYQDIIAILTGVHTAASIEVLTFAQKLGVDISLLAEIVENAAGSNRMFLKIVKGLGSAKNDVWSAMPELESVKRNLVGAARIVHVMKLLMLD